MSTDENILHELKAINKILILTNSDAIDHYLSKIIKTKVRRKIWANIDGVNRQKDLVEISGVKQGSVSEFLILLNKIGIIDYKPRSPPRKLIEYTPASWIEE